MSVILNFVINIFFLIDWEKMNSQSSNDWKVFFTEHFVFWRFQRTVINLARISALAFDWICFEISPGTRFNVLLRARRLLERERVCRFNEIAAPDVIRPLPVRPLHRESSDYLLQRSQRNFTSETVMCAEKKKKGSRLCVNYALNSSSLIKTTGGI